MISQYMGTAFCIVGWRNEYGMFYAFFTNQHLPFLVLKWLRSQFQAQAFGCEFLFLMEKSLHNYTLLAMPLTD
jgi:hypothetical protein